MRTGRAASIAALGFAASCSALRKANDTPHIDRMAPDSVMLASGVVIDVAVRGRGFAPGKPGRNTVTVGDVQLTDVPASDDGTELHFVVPERGSARGDAAPLPIESGAYDVRVRTSAGVSNAMRLRIDR
jgi:hypothetical protein